LIVGVFYFQKTFVVMSEIIIRTENKEALQKIADFLKVIGFEVIFKDRSTSAANQTAATPAVNGPADDYTDWLSLAGIWKDSPITAEELRLKAWGGRI
jgi:hypothetical protein